MSSRRRSLLLGGPGETHESLDNTVRFARWLIDDEMMAVVRALGEEVTRASWPEGPALLRSTRGAAEDLLPRSAAPGRVHVRAPAEFSARP